MKYQADYLYISTNLIHHPDVFENNQRFIVTSIPNNTSILSDKDKIDVLLLYNIDQYHPSSVSTIIINDTLLSFYEPESDEPLYTCTYSPTQLTKLLQNLLKRKQQNHQLMTQIYFDSLTGIGNRLALRENLDNLVINKIGFWLMMIDCDNFKIINDSYGHDVGDAYLIEFVRRVKQSLPNDCDVYRLSGDEIMVTMPLSNYSQPQVIKTIQEMRAAISRPFTYSNTLLQHNTCSIGISLYEENKKETACHIMQQADSAMYVIKHDGGDWYHFYDNILEKQETRRVQVTKHITQAQHHNEFEIYLQPINDCTNYHISGAECLLRWKSLNDPEVDISPMEFIPLLEQTGQIIPVGYWVIQESMKILKQLENDKIVNNQFWISINISPKQLNFELVDFIEQQLSIYQLKHEQICLEMTESIFIKPSKTVHQVITNLHDSGIRIYLDDFGTGYCSLSYLARWALDGIKIDKSFIQKMKPENIEYTITTAMTDIARHLNLAIVAEGVEDQTSLQHCYDQGCTHVQGNWFSSPLSIEQFKKHYNRMSGNIK